MSEEKRFVEVSARFESLEKALEWAHKMDDGGVKEISVDNGDGYGLRECSVDGCTAVLAYPDEGETCEDHWIKYTCFLCGNVEEYEKGVVIEGDGMACRECAEG
jgi:hypothetical protein